MALSRYYQPTNYEYMSQFVPKNLEIMDRGLQRAQAKQDKQVGKLDELNSMILKQNALEGYDTEVRDQVVGEVKSFSEEMANTDLTSPENFRKVNQFVQSMANDERLKKINQGLALDKEGRELYAKYQEDPDGFKYVAALDRYNPARQAYSKQSGDNKKFAADFLAGNTTWQAGVDKYAYKEKLFANIAQDGREYLQSLSDNDLKVFYENGWTGVTADKIKRIAGTEYDDYLRSPAGRQEAQELRYQYPGISTEELNNTMFTDFLQTGLKRAGIKTQSGQAAALNTREDLRRTGAKEQKDLSGVEQPGPNPMTAYKSPAHMLQEINNLTKLNTPESLVKARHLKAEQEKLTAKAVENLTPSEQKAVAVNFRDIESYDDLIAVANEATKGVGYDNALEHIYYALEKRHGKNTPEYKEAVKKAIKLQLRNLNLEDLNKATKNVYARKAGHSSYEDIDDKINTTFETGSGYEQTDIMPNVGNQKVKTYLDSQAATIVNDINFEPTAVIEKKTGAAIDNPFGTLENASLYADKTSFKVRKGIGGNKPAIVFSAKGPDSGGQFVEIVATPKTYTQSFEDFLVSTVGEKAATQIKEEFFAAGYAPVGSDSKYSQTLDMGLDEKVIGKTNIVPAGSRGVYVQNLDREGNPVKQITNDEVLEVLKNNVEPSLIPTILQTLGVGADVITNADGDLKLNTKYKGKPAKFGNHMNAKDFLSFKQYYSK